MSLHIFGTILTPHGVAANNRGENEGNLSTLQKLLWNGEVHSTVSGEAIRYALRETWMEDHENLLNRKLKAKDSTGRTKPLKNRIVIWMIRF
ncbi:hypothetical protein LEP1GSC037_0249 [Leptospira interrogans str. 2006001854]|uniref:Uncharacterized protein n=1 Tax=Leptospira interrogans str. 2006001854 TaxID=1001590 RepID=M6GE86_LEPIR|nr:hypothetical protein LEP1GSC037_0249 [Leptospira interrogans str. 2006001854]